MSYDENQIVQLVCFDIDGTLVDSAGFDGDLYAEAIEKVLGVELDTNWSQYENVSDSGILNEVLERYLPPNQREEAAREVQAGFLSRTKAHLGDHPNLIREIPGALALVETLLRSPAVITCIATGGWRATAELKLRSIGLEPERIAMASSSDEMRRTDIMRLAESRATNGNRIAKRTYFGDGCWDQKAARELGYEFVGVGSGVDHDVVFTDLQDLDAILAHLGV